MDLNRFGLDGLPCHVSGLELIESQGSLSFSSQQKDAFWLSLGLWTQNVLFLATLPAVSEIWNAEETKTAMLCSFWRVKGCFLVVTEPVNLNRFGLESLPCHVSGLESIGSQSSLSFSSQQKMLSGCHWACGPKTFCSWPPCPLFLKSGMLKGPRLQCSACSGV